jgi:tRNA A-37 threonylcarbamoyl transferase component Bud32
MLPSGAERRIADRYAMRVPPLGHGGMGVVWRAEDTLLGREVAIKEVRLPPTLAADERARMRARVMREARVAARLNHPGAVTLHDIVDEDGRPFIVMELVPAPTLTDLVAAEGTLPPARAAAIGLRLLDTLETAHRVGIVHRDVKPSNVMVCEDGSTKLTDFGIASLKGDPAVTASGLLLGSPAYMAPEQADQEPVGPPTDLWSLGATMYFAVEGVPPFERGGPVPTLAAVVGEDPRPMRRAGPLEPAITALLSKSPADRPTASEVRRALRKVAAHADDGDRTPAPGPADRAVRASGQVAVAAARPPAEPPVTVTAQLAALPGRSSPPPTAVVVEPGGALRAPAGRAAAPATAPAGARRRGPRLLTAVLATAVVLLLGLLGWRALTTPQQFGPDSASPAVPSAQRWEGYADRNGAYELQRPAGWTIREGPGGAWVEFVEPGDTGRRFKVQVDEDTKDPLRAWQEAEEGLRSKFPTSYRRIALERSAFEPPGTSEPVRAAVWEFSHESDQRLVRKWDLSLVTAERRYSVLFETGPADWASSTGMLSRFLQGFDPAR